MLRLALLGAPSLERGGGLVDGRAAHRHRLALLALLALAPGRRLGRDRLLAWLWPESDTRHGRNLLKVSTYVLRSALGDAALLSAGDELRLNSELVTVDVLEFEGALQRGDHARAAALYAGPFMDGFFLREAPAFERWLEAERARLAGGYARALEALADAAEAARHLPAAVEWWRRRAVQDPYDSRVAVRLMQALDAAGNRAGALQHAEIHQRLLRAEFGAAPAPDVAALAARLQREPATPVVPATPVAHATPAPPTSRPIESEHARAVAGVAPPRPAQWIAVAAVLLYVVFLGGAVLHTRPREVAVGDRAPGAAAEKLGVDAEARALHRRARYLWNQRTREGHARAIHYFHQAIERDSGYADAYAGLADVYLTGFQLGLLDLSEAESYARLTWAAERALALDDESADAHVAFAISLWWQRNWPGAARELRRAIALDPANATARSWYSLLLRGMGRGAEALRESGAAVEREPFAVVVAYNHAWQCHVGRDHACALEQYRRVLEISAYPGAWRGLGLLHAQQGRADEARHALEQAVALAPHRTDFLADLAYVHALAGRTREARATLDRAKAAPVEAFNIARAHAALGERDSAFAWLARSNWRWPHRATRDDPGLDPLRADARFAELDARVEREMGMR